MSIWDRDEVDSFWGLSAELEAALRYRNGLPQENDDCFPSELDQAEFCVAVRFGECRMFGVQVHPIDQVLFNNREIDRLYFIALRELNHIRLLLLDATKETGLLSGAAVDFESESAVLDILQSRLSFEGLRQILREVSLQTANIRISTFFEAFEVALENLDESISANADALAIAAQTAWPRNVALTLSADTWQPRPWWLTSELDAIYVSHHQLAGALMHIVSRQEFVVQLVTATGEFLDSELAVDVNRSDSFASNRDQFPIQIAADNRLGPSTDKIAEFLCKTSNLTIRCNLTLSSEYQGERLNELPDQVALTLYVYVQSLSEQVCHDPQNWRLRWLPQIQDIQLNPLNTTLTSGVIEWQGSTTLSARELKRITSKGIWPSIYLRRIS